ncbi:MAG: hypothetical protein JO006_09385 [Paucibacter sp.]|nr:hypothetical protein [Roseateles sp.]
MKVAAGIAAVLLAGPLAHAWSDHSFCTWQALNGMPELSGRMTQAESLGDYVRARADALPALLEREESWARAELPDYAPRPDALKFQAPARSAPDAAWQLAFLRAIRVNEQARLSLFLQRRPGQAIAPVRRLDWQAVSTLHSGSGNAQFEKLDAGEAVSAYEVIATASSEPDYGLDLGLWADSGTAQGMATRFGPLPFGNPRFEYSGQAPFHMGFFHESRVIYAAAGYLKRSYVEARIHLYLSLARDALAHGRAYWGWRFTGWAMHYVQDLTQPYHARVLPGIGTGRLIWIDLQDLLGRHGPKNDAINRVTNRHTVIEGYQLGRMAMAYSTGHDDEPLFLALRDTSGDRANWQFGPHTGRDLVSAEAAAAADALDAQLVLSFPSHYTDDPATDLSKAKDIDFAAIAHDHAPDQEKALLAQMRPLMQAMGRHSRAVVRAALSS